MSSVCHARSEIEQNKTSRTRPSASLRGLRRGHPRAAGYTDAPSRLEVKIYFEKSPNWRLSSGCFRSNDCSDLRTCRKHPRNAERISRPSTSRSPQWMIGVLLSHPTSRKHVTERPIPSRAIVRGRFGSVSRLALFSTMMTWMLRAASWPKALRGRESSRQGKLSSRRSTGSSNRMSKCASAHRRPNRRSNCDSCE